jgi:ribosomal protein L15E
MTAKTKKEFQAENSDLRKRLNMVIINFDKLSEDHKSLQTKVILEKEKKNVCKRCDENLESVNDVRKHRAEHPLRFLNVTSA